MIFRSELRLATYVRDAKQQENCKALAELLHVGPSRLRCNAQQALHGICAQCVSNRVIQLDCSRFSEY